MSMVVLRKGLVWLGLLLDCGPGVVDTFLAYFFFFLFSLLWVLHRLSIDCLVSCVMWLLVGSPHSVVEYCLSVGVDGRYACLLSDAGTGQLCLSDVRRCYRTLVCQLWRLIVLYRSTELPVAYLYCIVPQRYRKVDSHGGT